MPAALFLFVFSNAAIDFVVAQEESSGASIVLPSMTVFATKKSDNTYDQVSEVEWQDGKDPTIVREKDGTYTASSTSNSYSLNVLLASLGRPTLNVDLGYAVDSISMTAEGSLTLNTLLEAFEYLNDDVILELMPSAGDGSRESKRIMQRRLEVLRKTFERSSQVSFKVMPPKVSGRTPQSSTRSDIWRIQIRRTG